VLISDARLLEVIICWIVFVSLLIDHLKNTEEEGMECLDDLLPSEMDETINFNVPHHFTEGEDFLSVSDAVFIFLGFSAARE